MKGSVLCMVMAAAQGIVLKNKVNEPTFHWTNNIDYGQFNDDHRFIMQADLQHHPNST